MSNWKNTVKTPTRTTGKHSVNSWTVAIVHVDWRFGKADRVQEPTNHLLSRLSISRCGMAVYLFGSRGSRRKGLATKTHAHASNLHPKHTHTFGANALVTILSPRCCRFKAMPSSLATSRQQNKALTAFPSDEYHCPMSGGRWCQIHAYYSPKYGCKWHQLQQATNNWYWELLEYRCLKADLRIGWVHWTNKLDPQEAASRSPRTNMSKWSHVS